MKLAVISDIHDNLTNLQKCLTWCGENAIEAVICCGDVTNAETLSLLTANFSGSIHLVQGNMEIFENKDVAAHAEDKKFFFHQRLGCANFGGKTIAFCHEPFLADDAIAKCKRTLQKKPDIVFYGHTHKPWIEEKDGLKLANPGTLGGVFGKATFAVYDTESGGLELKLLENILNSNLQM